MPGSPSSFDAVVVGAGAAGLVASLRAATLGMRVVLLDAAAGEQSNLSVSGGMFAAAGTRVQEAAGIVDSPALWAADIAHKTHGAFDPAMVHTITTRAADATHFLTDTIGLPLHVVNLPVPGHSALRLHATPGESGTEMATLLGGRGPPHARHHPGERCAGDGVAHGGRCGRRPGR